MGEARMRIVMSFANPTKDSKEPSKCHFRAFERLDRMPLVGEYIRFRGADHKVLTVVTDLDDEVVRIDLSGPE